VALSDRWRSFYASAQQQNVIDPAMLTAIAISESGPTKYGLGIDSTGTPGLPGTPGGDGNATHRFYSYADGLEAARGLTAYLQTHLYSGTDILNMGPERMLGTMVTHGYSGCDANRGGGGECDPHWDSKIMQLRTQVVSEFGPPNAPIPGSGIGGLTPVQGGGNPDPIAAAGGAVGGAVQGAGQALASWQDSLKTLLGAVTSHGFWWSVLLFGGGVAAILAGVLLYFKAPQIAVKPGPKLAL